MKHSHFAIRSLSVAALAASTLANGTVKPFEKPHPPVAHLGTSCSPTASTADLCIPLDATFAVATMDANTGGNGQADPSDPCQLNDDDSTNAINLPFTFDLFGSPQTQVFINNNGNVSFGAPFATFTSSGFPVSGFPMIAPFWADVDTRGGAPSGTVWFRVEAHRLTVTWDHVGYYDSHNDKLSTFQVIITDGTDPLVGIGNNVCFCYGDMGWTTGDASSGSGGFGGFPATVGINAGDGVNFFQIGQFDHAGVDYDGPGGANDGVDFLDHQRNCFATGTVTNTPPIFINTPSSCLMASVGVPLTFTIQAIGPEAPQTVNIVETSGTANVTCVATPGNPASITCTFTPSIAQTGTTTLHFVATDDFVTPATSSLDVCINAAECHTLLGRGGTGSDITLFGTLYHTHLGSVRSHWPVTMTDRPNVRIPGLLSGSISFSVQTLMHNPLMFPTNPDQWSQRLRVTVYPGHVVQGELFDSWNGIHQSLATFTDPSGVHYMTFPFTIDGM